MAKKTSENNSEEINMQTADSEKPAKSRRGRPRKKAADSISDNTDANLENADADPSVLENESLYTPSEQDQVPAPQEQSAQAEEAPFVFSQEPAAESYSDYGSGQSQEYSSSDDYYPDQQDSSYSSYTDSQKKSEDQRIFELEMSQEKADVTMSSIVQAQRSFFATNQTRNVEWRLEQLKKLYAEIKANEQAITVALQKDLSKAPQESFALEIGPVLHEISYACKNLRKWVKPQKVSSDLVVFPAKLKIMNDPLGVTLIISTWNYPFQLSITPLISAIAAGNTAVLKTSEFSPATNAVIKNIIEKLFDPAFIAVVTGGYTENHALLNQRFDFIFFTGSQNLGRVVMSSASRFLTPICLELGGKSPCIIDATANLELAARRITWGKFVNAGQTCVAPDYVLIDSGVKDKFIELVKAELIRQYGEKPLENPEYCKIVNERRFVHLSTLCPKAEMDFITNKIAPTVMDLGDIRDKAANESDVMKEEIFGPLLPVISYDNLNNVISFINERPSSLSLYLFSTNQDTIDRILSQIRFGGGCINDVVYHLASTKIPFGGVGESGMGSYHGKAGFDQFTHKKSILVQSVKHDFNFRYAPYTQKALNMLKHLLK